MVVLEVEQPCVHILDVGYLYSSAPSIDDKSRFYDMHIYRTLAAFHLDKDAG